MYYLKSRYYDPEVCRFINADDSANLGVDNTILSHNLYSYCGNNPVDRKDIESILLLLFAWQVVFYSLHAEAVSRRQAVQDRNDVARERGAVLLASWGKELSSVPHTCLDIR